MQVRNGIVDAVLSGRRMDAAGHMARAIFMNHSLMMASDAGLE